jgi:hypothetical protein
VFLQLTGRDAAGNVSAVPINVVNCLAVPTRAVLGNFGAAIPQVAGANADHRVVGAAGARVTLTPVVNPVTGVTALGPATDVNGDTFFLPYEWNKIYSIELPDPVTATANGTTSFLTIDLSGCKVYVDPIAGGNGAVVVYHANNVSNPPPVGSLPTVETPACTAFLDNLHHQARMWYQAAPQNLNLPLAGSASVDKPHYNIPATGEVMRKQGQKRTNVDFSGGTMVFGVVNGNKWDFYWETWGSTDYDRPFYAPKVVIKGFHNTASHGNNFRVLGSGQFF